MLIVVINYEGSWTAVSHGDFFFDIGPLDCFKFVFGYWLVEFNRRANDKVVACLEMTLQSAKIIQPLIVMTFLTTSAVWHCAFCTPAHMRLCSFSPHTRSPDGVWYFVCAIWTCQRSLVGRRAAYTKMLFFNATRGSGLLWRRIGSLLRLLSLSTLDLCVRAQSLSGVMWRRMATLIIQHISMTHSFLLWMSAQLSWCVTYNGFYCHFHFFLNHCIVCFLSFLHFFSLYVLGIIIFGHNFWEKR